MGLPFVSLLDLKNKDILKLFSCVRDSDSNELKDLHKKVDEYLHEKAYTHHHEQLSRTHLLLTEDEKRVIGFFTLCNDSIDFKLSHGKKQS